MTPAARIASAIEILDRVLDGAPAEKTLTNWARSNRFAGSGDRAAIRDLVFEAIRCRRSHAWLGGADTGRGLMLGRLRAIGEDPAALFTGLGYAPAALLAGEAQGDLAEASQAVQLDMPDWLMPRLQADLGRDMAAICDLLRSRAPVFLRVNAGKSDVAGAQAVLLEEGIETVGHPLSPFALAVKSNPRRVQNSRAFRDGLVDLQDVASQAVVDSLPMAGQVLDFCAGGGGKSLALAARGMSVVAHDVDPGRMKDIPVRAARAGVRIETVDHNGITAAAPFDLVLCDAPCSGSGAWRRTPEAKWMLSDSRLDQLTAIQAEILNSASALVAPGGTLAYATCSMFDAENGAQAQAFLRRNPSWRQSYERRYTVLDGGDGFYVTHLTQKEKQS